MRPSVRAKPLTDGHPKAVTPSESKPPVAVRQKEPTAAAQVAGTPAPTAAEQRELPPPTLRPPPEAVLAAASAAPGTAEIAPPPVFIPSSPPIELAALGLPPIIEAQGAGATETFRPSEVDRTPSLAPKRGNARWLQAAAAVAVLAIGGGALFKLRSHAAHQPNSRPTAMAARAALPEPVKAPAPPAAAAVEATPAPQTPAPEETPPAPKPETSAAAPPVAGPDLTSAFAAALSGSAPSANAVAVTVRVTPAGAIIFERGKRLGTDVVQVSVEPGGKKNLVALMDGYQPRRFSVDGSLNSVTIALRPGLPTPNEPAGSYTPPPAAAAAPAAAAPAPARPAAPPPKAAATGKKEPFDPSRDVGSL